MAIRAEEIDDVNGRVDLDRDRLLVLRHQRGDADAFDELYRRYHPRLVLYCRRRVGDPHVAEELAQEAFLRALRAMPQFGGDRRFYPWMTVIAGRLCIDHHRRSARVEPSPDVDNGTVEPEHDAVYRAVDRAQLELALGRLAPRHREVLDLREQRGWSYNDIASHLDVPMTTVEALLHRARKALRREFLAVGGDRGAAAAIPVAGIGLIARLKRGLLAMGPERLAPALGAAAAGVAAVGLVAGPALLDQHGPSAGAPVARSSTTVDATGVAATGSSLADASTAAAGGADGAAGSTPSAARPAGTTAAADEPPASGALGPVTVYDTPEGQAYVDQQIEDMPVVVDAGIFRVGIDPATLLGPQLAPAVSPDVPEESP